MQLGYLLLVTASGSMAAAVPWEIYYVEAALGELWDEPFPVLSAAAEAYHSGVALRAPNGSMLVYEFDAAYGVASAVVPTPTSDGSGLVWRNRGIVMEYTGFTDGLNRSSYWQRANFLGTMPEELVSPLVSWVKDVYNSSGTPGQDWSPIGGNPYLYYSPFDVVDPQTGTMRVRSQTCNDFSFDVVSRLQSMGVFLNPLIPNKKSRCGKFPRCIRMTLDLFWQCDVAGCCALQRDSLQHRADSDGGRHRRGIAPILGCHLYDPPRSKERSCVARCCTAGAGAAGAQSRVCPQQWAEPEGDPNRTLCKMGV